MSIVRRSNRRYGSITKPGQTVEQVWFCGADSGVGGGYPECELSHITLEWMMTKAEGAGLRFDPDVARAFPPKPSPLGNLHNSKAGLYPAHHRD